MGRLIGSVVAGYVVMFVLVVVLFSLAYLALGADGAFQPGSWQVSPGWLALSISVGVVAALAGGATCAAIARTPTGAKALAGVVLVLGLLMAIPMLIGTPEPAVPRPDEVGLTDAMSNGTQPIWLALANPIIGAVLVLVGGRLARRDRA